MQRLVTTPLPAVIPGEPVTVQVPGVLIGAALTVGIGEGGQPTARLLSLDAEETASERTVVMLMNDSMGANLEDGQAVGNALAVYSPQSDLAAVYALFEVITG